MISSSSSSSSGLFSGLAIMGTGSMIVSFCISILSVITLWIIFNKCGKPGWASIVPIWNLWVLFEITDLPGWLSLLPVANIIGALVASFRLSKVFGKGAGFGLGLIFFNTIFMCILAFDKNAQVGGGNVQEETISPEPNLMAPDPNANGQVNLMTPDPISSMPEQPTPAPVVPQMEEQPSLEAQMNSQMPASPSIEPAIPEMPTPIVPESTVAPQQTTPVNVVDAFNMPSPSVNNQVVNNTDVNSLNTNPLPINNGPENIAPMDSVEMPALNQAPVTENPFVTPPTDNASVKKCANCGFDNPSTSAVCSNCGQIL